MGGEIRLGDYTGTIDEVTVNASWGPGADADSGAAPESASIDYRLVLTGDASIDAISALQP